MEVYYKKIFRPWDNSSENKNIILNNNNLDIVSYQDCTISTTTVENGEKAKKELELETKSEKTTEYKDIIVPLNPSSEIIKNHQTKVKNCDIKNKSNEVPPNCSINPHMYPSDFYPSTYHEYPPYDFLHGFPTGVSTQDAMFMESLAAHGYAMDEYIRVLNQEHQTKLLSNRKQRPKKYKCPHCDVGFSNNGQLKGHIRIHTGERPFRCDEKNCGKTFTRNEELTRHKRIHSGLRPFACTACGKRFGRKDHLKKHTRTHSQSTHMHRNGLQLVPVVLPASAWASIPPTSGVPMYNPNMMITSGVLPTFPPSSASPPSSVASQTLSSLGRSEGVASQPTISYLHHHHHQRSQPPSSTGTSVFHHSMYGL